jgi:hypothetical protein
MDVNNVFVDAFDRIRGIVHRVVDGLDADALAFRPRPDANSIAWLVWHLTRIQDDHVAGIAGIEQAWTGQGWAERFALPFPTDATGYGQTSTDVAAIHGVTADLLAGYHDAAFAQTVRYVERLERRDLDRIVDESWDPPVSLGVRLVSVVADDLQHAGQAAYVRGLLMARSR